MRLRHILIGGTSHAGKSTLAAELGRRLRWPVDSTDAMARHPGRPWPQLRPQVGEFYRSLSPETIHWFLKVHHDNMWPLITQRLACVAADGGTLVLEGSALRPERMAALVSGDLFACLLHVAPDRLTERMYIASDYRNRDSDSRLIIDRFLERSIRDGSEVSESARQHGVPIFDAEQTDLPEAVFHALARQGAGPDE